MSRFEDVKLTVQQLSSDGEAKCAEIETLTAELQQAKLAISVSKTILCSTLTFKSALL